MSKFICLAGVFGMVGVGLGAFGAHGLEDQLIKTGHLDTWDTATLYLFVHTLALLTCGLHGPANSKFVNLACWGWATGIVVFSGSLYILSLSQLSILGAITPVGGVCFIMGWGALLAAGLKGNLS